jgi:hypothetical protein
MYSEIEVEVAEDHPIFSVPFAYFRYVDGQIIKDSDLELTRARQKKDRELNKACMDAILEGFTHEIDGVTYWFSYDTEAQGNFRDAKDMLGDGVVESFPWTVRVGGKYGPYARIPITLAQMKVLAIVIMQHKVNNIGKYRDTLLPIVNSATEVSEVEAVTWE